MVWQNNRCFAKCINERDLIIEEIEITKITDTHPGFFLFESMNNCIFGEVNEVDVVDEDDEMLASVGPEVSGAESSSDSTAATDSSSRNDRLDGFGSCFLVGVESVTDQSFEL